MREIKFRGKRKDNGEWVYGVPYTKEIYSVEHKKFIGYKTYIIRYLADNLWTVTREEVISETVGQYTGLKDRNGMEIYEGDVVRWTHDFCCGEFTEKVEHQKINGVILWAEQVGKFMMKDTDNNHWDFKRIQTNQCLEIIGNIHEGGPK